MQMHISLSGKDQMRIAWVSLFAAESVVYYGTSAGNYTHTAKGSNNIYHFLNYFSPTLHTVVIGPLSPNTIYYYRCSNINSSQQLTFKTPPSRFPIKFAVVGTLGHLQSHVVISTLHVTD